MFRDIREISRKFLASARGHVAILTAVAAPALVGSVGLGAEAGLWFYQQRVTQMSADVAAYAGAVEARAGGQYDAIRPAVIGEAERHGYDPAAGPITVNWPPASGSNMNERSVEVLITQTRPRLLSAMFLDSDVVMNVRAVASFDEPGPACILALDPVSSQSLIFTGSSAATLTNCDLMSNSLAIDALAVTGSGTVNVSCANSVGGVEVSATLNLMDCPEPRTNLPPALDPYADLPEPPIPSGCQNVPGGGQPKTISPGHYCNGLDLRGDITMEPGVYIVSGDVTSNGNANVTGAGVTIFVRNNGEIRMNGNAYVNLSAPESGTYAGVLFWGDDDNLASTPTDFNGTADSALVGALYFPSQTVSMRGDFAGSGGCTRIIGYRVDVSGNTSFDSDCTGNAGVTTVHVPGVVRLTE
ncbi:hypothetical protein E5163_07835 [Marinicauda algicola]|uniref:DUF7305 domain-containing protein n=1 Tax=Marinicauda algicola TaxID=2029849 RepID=A0A4S2H194_9PROT|nr:hypothetical protein [Marinicauda algicola]TGY89031.1 hypothetical protein E5163_07835 [Marinicauda algicola]